MKDSWVLFVVVLLGISIICLGVNNIIISNEIDNLKNNTITYKFQMNDDDREILFETLDEICSQHVVNGDVE